VAGEATATRPDVREAEARVAMAEAALDKAARDGRIDMSLYGTYSRMDAGFPQLGFAPDGGVERVRAVFHYVAGGVRIVLPLANRNQGTLAAARADRAGAEAARNAALLSAEAETAAALARDQRAQAALRIYRTGLTELAGKNLSVVQQSYELGRSTLLDVLGELRRYLDVERAYSEAMRLGMKREPARLLATEVGDDRPHHQHRRGAAIASALGLVIPPPAHSAGSARGDVPRQKTETMSGTRPMAPPSTPTQRRRTDAPVA
jgi:hypothetical protein